MSTRPPVVRVRFVCTLPRRGQAGGYPVSTLGQGAGRGTLGPSASTGPTLDRHALGYPRAAVPNHLARWHA